MIYETINNDFDLKYNCETYGFNLKIINHVNNVLFPNVKNPNDRIDKCLKNPFEIAYNIYYKGLAKSDKKQAAINFSKLKVHEYSVVGKMTVGEYNYLIIQILMYKELMRIRKTEKQFICKFTNWLSPKKEKWRENYEELINEALDDNKNQNQRQKFQNSSQTGGDYILRDSVKDCKKINERNTFYDDISIIDEIC